MVVYHLPLPRHGVWRLQRLPPLLVNGCFEPSIAAARGVAVATQRKHWNVHVGVENLPLPLHEHRRLQLPPIGTPVRCVSGLPLPLHEHRRLQPALR